LLLDPLKDHRVRGSAGLAHDQPNTQYTRTWSPEAGVEYATLADGTRVRYLKAGSGPPLILLHTVRTQLDHFQFVIPKLVHAFTRLRHRPARHGLV
jgi:hypothetical protein